MNDADRYQRYRRALTGETLPAAVVDLDAVDTNIQRLVAPIRAAGKALRIATKSVRCPALIDYLVEKTQAIGLMTFTAAETAMLADAGHKDLLLAYPTVQPADLDAIAAANHSARAAIVVDCAEHVEAIEAAATRAKTTVPI